MKKPRVRKMLNILVDDMTVTLIGPDIESLY